MNNPRRSFDRFCIKYRNRGIRNLMLYIAIGNAVIYFLSMIFATGIRIGGMAVDLQALLVFDGLSVLHGQVWRLVTFLLVPGVGSGFIDSLILLLVLFFYYRIGIVLEQALGTLRFNLFYLTGVILMDLFGVIFGLQFNGTVLNLSLLLAFATLYPENRMLLMYIIPIKLKYLAWFYMAWTVFEVVLYKSFFPLVPLANYVLFFWNEIPGLVPLLRKPKKKAKPSQDWASGYQSKTGQKPYRHKCTVCGRTDTDYPNLEFRYCSKCNGYYCYCMDHINDHVHIQ